MKFIILFFIICTSINASEEEVISTLWHQLGHPPLMKKSNRLEKQESFTYKKTETKELTPGQKKIEEIKARNRKILRERKIETHTNDYSLNNKQLGLIHYKKLVDKTLSDQKKQIAKTREKWQESRRIFLKNIESYKENTFDIQSASNNIKQTKINFLPGNIDLKKGRDYYVIKNAFDITVKDQGKRPTCSAFAGASAIEILLRQSQSNLEVSEQYLYWSSKPYCQSSPCSKKGSWISHAYDRSISSKGFDIPSTEDCPYSIDSLPGNETQIPLKSGCQKGRVKIDNYQEISSSLQLYNSLNNNNPVIIGVKLSPNFYTSTGIISYQESLVNGKIDNHASGHALLIIGHMKLPQAMRSEGKVCYLAVNSWTEGWGAGGYGCITEKWLTKYKVRNPFMALTKVRSL